MECFQNKIPMMNVYFDLTIVEPFGAIQDIKISNVIVSWK